ncbi:inosine monophosphate dehydrogenase [Cucurbitaria berberidis CBS 394.84]|uniref:Inosine monophosphate dehydrogenase n=1 Tax=Cucurbitaria berberidis CBS 394.84 TaxID=1168544 RepID=A0A9P4GPH3_9PLEO|nr:inosine monophosphate dehydrogenase [Cucurbitaria berberidis CBS 394.84]KAF1848800.1 inosine monophosphate dehydrogenase [Cucurbitaria berberidis CBS 394.84]
MSTLRDQLPWTSSPIIANAPMAGFAGGKLASTVTLAGGLGLVGGLFNMDDLRKELQVVSEALASDPILLSSKTVPVGVGLLPFVLKLDEVLPVIGEFRPAVVWLFAAKSLDDYTAWASAIRNVSPDSKIWIQVGSVSAALHIARTAAPDVFCLQGADAGGHGFEKGAGIISLLPEASDTLAKEGYSHIPLVASGGIVDGRGVAAALALGAQGVVMGTRFLASKEVAVHPNYQAAVLEAHDGGQVTTRSKLFDQLRGPNIWPELYDGRSLVVQSHKDYVNGVSLGDIQKLHKEAVGKDDRGFKTGLQGRAAIWAGTGVGLVKEVESAKVIVEGVRTEAKGILAKVARF